MSNDFNLTEVQSSTAPTIDDQPVDVDYPDGTVERVEPECDIFLATGPRESLEAPLEKTRTSRLEMVEETYSGHFDKQHIQQDLIDARAVFEAEYGYPDADVIIELAYFRTVGGKKTLCVQLRGAADEVRYLSQFFLHVDERLRNEF